MGPPAVAPGEEPAVVAADGWRLGLAICEDTGTPPHAAAGGIARATRTGP